jgi:hypothetical protein
MCTMPQCGSFNNVKIECTNYKVDQKRSVYVSSSMKGNKYPTKLQAIWLPDGTLRIYASVVGDASLESAEGSSVLE